MRGRNTLYLDYRQGVAREEHEAERPRFVHFALQSVLAAAAVGAVILATEYFTSLLAVAAVGSTAFLVFARPRSIESRLRNVLVGYVISTASGLLAAVCVWYVPLPVTVSVALFSGCAIGVAAFAMSITDTEHAPAAGAAIAIVINNAHLLETTLVALGGGVAVCAVGLACGRWLRDLT
jgi:CBS-domain-containing membrane protein